MNMSETRVVNMKDIITDNYKLLIEGRIYERCNQR